METIACEEAPAQPIYSIEYNGERKIVGDSWKLGDMLRCLTILGFTEFKIFVV
jgi:hypothetical protein